MNAEKYKKYKVFCMFFRRIGLFKEFQEYQRSKKINGRSFRVDTEDIIKDFGNTQITYWLERKKGRKFVPTLFHPFVDFLTYSHP